jgi:hypothetical protein
MLAQHALEVIEGQLHRVSQASPTSSGTSSKAGSYLPMTHMRRWANEPTPWVSRCPGQAT